VWGGKTEIGDTVEGERGLGNAAHILNYTFLQWEFSKRLQDYAIKY